MEQAPIAPLPLPVLCSSARCAAELAEEISLWAPGLPVEALDDAAGALEQDFDLVLLRAGDILTLEALAAAGEQPRSTRAAPTLVAIAFDEAEGLTAVRRGAHDWVAAGDRAGLLRIVRICRARGSRRPSAAEPPPAAGGADPLSELADGLDRGEFMRELRGTRDASLRTVGLLLEQRDLETKGHTDRVVTLSEHLAEHVGLGSAERQALRWGAYLHDIGKIALPDRILFKPARLTEGEFAVVRRHADLGFEMTVELPFLPVNARALVRHHHERWNGHGYPGRLAGDDIPLLARLFSMVDVFDALSSKRPYKPAWPRERALQAIRAGAGRDFDPRLTEAFVAMMEHFAPPASRSEELTAPAGS